MENIAELEALELTAEDMSEVSGGAIQYKQPPEKLGFRIYQIGHGDNLNKIARHFGVTVKQILDWNPYIKNRNRIYAGAYLYIGQ